MRKINERFFIRPADELAKELLGKIIVRKIDSKELRVRIVETEAYFGPEDPASRARQNGDLKKTMGMAPGTILVYGVHNNWLVNFVNNLEGIYEAVLIRAIEPLNFSERGNGPGLVTKALKINKEFHKQNVLDNKEIWLENDGFVVGEIVESFRIGVVKDLEKPLRFYIKDNVCISRK